MRIFDTNVQLLKYKVLKEVAIHAYKDDLLSCYYKIPTTIIPGKEATMRCCVYKERAIVNERIKLATGGDNENPNVIEVLGIACDECPVSSYTVSNACRGCIAHMCGEVCPVKAITYENQIAHIDSEKCIECGKCATVCPYSAISSGRRPCEKACKIKAITMNENKKAHINNEKCIACGACVYQCPFGAIMDKSFILDAIHFLKESQDNTKFNVYAVVAPSIASQFSYAKLGQVISGMKVLGFHKVVEAAIGADMVAQKEARELKEKGFLTSSCCPAFVQYIENEFPQLAKYISHNLSPMAEISKYIKSIDPSAKVVFIGPCTAKKMEYKKDSVKDYVDCVLTFEELQALIDARGIEVETLKEAEFEGATYYGRVFARSGGLSEAVKQAVVEQNLEDDRFKCLPIDCDGIDQCKVALLKKNKNVLAENFIEGMACSDGCIGGAACLTHLDKHKKEVDKHAEMAKIKKFDIGNLQF